jgi:hypothetical protein
MKPERRLTSVVGALSDCKLGAPRVTVKEGRLAHADLDVVSAEGVAYPRKRA